MNEAPTKNPEFSNRYRRLIWSCLVLTALCTSSTPENPQIINSFAPATIQTLASLTPQEAALFNHAPASQTLSPVTPSLTPTTYDHTLEMTSTPTPEPTPTDEQRIHAALTQFTGLDFSKESQSIAFSLPIEGAPLQFAFKPVVYHPTQPLETYFDQTAPGKGTAGIVVDEYQNLQVEAHSGQKNFQDLEAESLRRFAEGVGVPSTLTPAELLEIQRKLERTFIGQPAILTPENGNPQPFTIVDVGYIPHEKLGGDDVLDVIRQIYPLTDRANVPLKNEFGLQISRFDRYTHPQKPTLLILFCGRTVDRAQHPQDWYIWSRIVLFLQPAAAPDLLAIE